MATKNLVVTCCDECGKEISLDKDNVPFGLSMNGWLKITQSADVPRIMGGPKPINADFCSEQCAFTFLKKRQESND